MRLYYTVISQEGASQSSPLNSLGGFCSSSPVQSGDFNSMFGDISSYTLQKKNREYVALMLKNELSVPVKGIKLWVDIPEDPICGIRVAAIFPNDDGEMEAVSSPNSKPLQAVFYDAPENDPIEIEGSLEPGGLLGIWIERRVLEDSEQVVKAADCNYLFEKYMKKESLSAEESQVLHISWEEEV